MFTQRELAALAAALRFWCDEMIPQGPNLIAWYFEGLAAEPLSDEEVTALWTRVREMASAPGTPE